MDGAYAHLAACYKRTTDHCIAELNGCLTPGAWLKSSCLAGCFFQESLNKSELVQGLHPNVNLVATTKSVLEKSAEHEILIFLRKYKNLPFLP